MIQNINGRDYFSDSRGDFHSTLPAQYNPNPLKQLLWWWLFRKNIIDWRGIVIKNWQLLVSCLLFVFLIISLMQSRTEYIIEQRESIRFIPGPTDTITQTNTVTTREVVILYSDDPKVTKNKKKYKKATSQDRLNYLVKYKNAAKAASRESGLPASIILAQALLESGAGLSRLAIESNNHFGIKCFSKKCGRWHCSNYEDDTHKDFFRNFKNAEESFVAHSAFIKQPRYKKARKKRGYEAVAYAISEAGYATDPQYAPKLIGIIKTYRLWELD